MFDKSLKNKTLHGTFRGRYGMGGKGLLPQIRGGSGEGVPVGATGRSPLQTRKRGLLIVTLSEAKGLRDWHET